MEEFLNNTTETLQNISGSLRNGSITTSSPVARTAYDDVLVGLEYVNMILLPTCMIIGVFGNMITAVVMNTKAFATLTSRYFLMSLAISDTILLLTQPFNKMFVIKYFGTDLRALSDVGCKLYFWFFKNGKMTSSWFVVFLCLERFTAVQFPFKVKSVFCKRNCLIGIAVVYSGMGIYNGIWSYASKIADDGLCHPDVYDKSDPAAVTLFGVMLTIGSSLYSILPICILITVTPVIIVNLVKRSKARKAMTQKHGRDMDITRITFMLLAVVVTYVLLVAPVTFLHNIAFHTRLHAFGNNNKSFLVFRDVTQILEQFNYTINFFLYVASNRQFRKAVSELLGLDKLISKCRTTNEEGNSSQKQDKTLSTDDAIKTVCGA